MKTLIFNGSPRLKGDTRSLINVMLEDLQGEYKIVNAYNDKIAPCIDCRYCWYSNGCAFRDDMQKIYEYIEECDNILIASPIYYSQLTGPLLSVASRLQIYYCAEKFRGEQLIEKKKRGAVLLVGGGDGDPERAFGTAKTLLHQMNCKEIYDLVCCHNTNVAPALEDENAVNGAKKIAEYFNANNVQ